MTNPSDLKRRVYEWLEQQEPPPCTREYADYQEEAKRLGSEASSVLIDVLQGVDDSLSQNAIAALRCIGWEAWAHGFGTQRFYQLRSSAAADWVVVHPASRPLSLVESIAWRALSTIEKALARVSQQVAGVMVHSSLMRSSDGWRIYGYYDMVNVSRGLLAIIFDDDALEVRIHLKGEAASWAGKLEAIAGIETEPLVVTTTGSDLDCALARVEESAIRVGRMVLGPGHHP
jgi:hypothetical protein